MFFKDFRFICEHISTSSGCNLNHFWADLNKIATVDSGKMNKFMLYSRVKQLTNLLDYQYPVLDKIDVKALFSSIRDEKLRERCSELLISTNHFDRAVNQATLVLEDRLRELSNAEQNCIGDNLVKHALFGENPPIKISHSKNVRTGFGLICKGIVAYHRNPTHHGLEEISQQHALSVCLYIDMLLSEIMASSAHVGESA